MTICHFNINYWFFRVKALMLVAHLGIAHLPGASQSSTDKWSARPGKKKKRSYHTDFAGADEEVFKARELHIHSSNQDIRRKWQQIKTNDGNISISLQAGDYWVGGGRMWRMWAPSELKSNLEQHASVQGR